MSSSLWVWLSVFALAITGGACDLNAFAANQAGSIAVASMPHMRGFWDYEIAREGSGAAIMQLEAMHAVSADNESLTLALTSAYVGYAFGWVELDLQQARADRQFARADRLRARAELIYRRARDLGLRTMRERDAAIDDQIVGEVDGLRAYLKQHYSDPKADLAPLFWTAMSWGAMLSMTNELDATVDLPVIRAMIEHVVALDPAYESAAGLVFLGGLYAQTPPDFGGDLAKAKEYFERALKLTERRSYVVQLNYAKSYALTAGDTALFRSLLGEILAPEDRGNDVRLSNKIARMHAELLMRTQFPSQEVAP